MTQDEAAARAQVKASICTPASLRKAELGMMPFLMVSAVRAPTATAPTVSKMVPHTMAHRYEMERDETDVAHALATSSGRRERAVSRAQLEARGGGSRGYALAPLLKASSRAKKVPITNT